MAKIRIDGKWYDWEDSTISGERVRVFMRSQGRSGYDNSRVFSFTTSNMRTQNRLSDEEEVPIDSNAVIQLTSFPATSIYGIDVSTFAEDDFNHLGQREKFILSQVFQVSERYFSRNRNPIFLSKNCDFLVIKDFPIPPLGDYHGRSTNLCLYFPQNYPINAPVGFFIDKRLQAKSGAEVHKILGTAVYSEPNAFFQKNGLDNKGYAFFCWHIEKNWRPDLTNPFQPDNLDSFLKLAYMALDSKAIHGRRRYDKIY